MSQIVVGNGTWITRTVKNNYVKLFKIMNHNNINRKEETEKLYPKENDFLKCMVEIFHIKMVIIHRTK